MTEGPYDDVAEDGDPGDPVNPFIVDDFPVTQDDSDDSSGNDDDYPYD